jgi:hypothetical protein
MEQILHAAILRTDKVIIFDRDHAACIIRSPYGTCKEGSVKGFLTNKLRFVNRYKAAEIAFKAKQIEKWEVGQAILSEEFWSPQSGGKYLYDGVTGYYLTS